MNIDNYHHLVNKLGDEVKNFDRSILTALDNEQPSVWVPEVRKSLLNFYERFPEFEQSKDVLKLYIQGEHLQYTTDLKLPIVVGIVCFSMGVAAGWLL